MLTNECWLGLHQVCGAQPDCDCLCHEVFNWDDADVREYT